MKKLMHSIILIAFMGFVTLTFAQEAKTVKLVQTEGKFLTETLNLKAGNYVLR